MENRHLKEAKAMDIVTSPHLRRKVGTIFPLWNTYEEIFLSIHWKSKGSLDVSNLFLCLYLQLTLRRRRLRIQTRLARFRTVSGWCSLLPIRSQTSATPLKPKAGVYEEGPFWGTSDDVCRFLCSSRDAVPLIFSQSNPEVFGALVSFSCALLWQVCYVIISGPIWGVTVSC